MGSNNSSLNQLIENDVTTSVITNIITNNETNSTNIITLSNKFDIIIGKGGTLDCDNISLQQLNQGTIKIATQVNSQTASNLQNHLINDLKNSSSQTNKLVQGFLAGIGQFNNNNLNQSIVNRISNLIQNNVTTNNINKILSAVNIQNTGSIVIDDGGTIKGKQCDFLQTNIADFSSSLIVSNLANAIATDQVLNKLVNTASQDNSVEQKGLDSLLSALLLPLIIIMVCLSYVGGKAVNSKPLGYILLLVVVVLLIVGLLKYFKVGVFKDKPPLPPQYWTCQTDSNGFNTGKCVQVDHDPGSGSVFSSQDLCESNVANGTACSTFWGCTLGHDGFNTGAVQQCKDVVTSDNLYCQYSDEKSAAGACHNFFYECDSGSDGKNTCNQINPPDSSYQATVYSSTVSPADALTKCKAQCS